MSRINIGTRNNPHYLYPSIESNPHHYCELYDSAEECLEDIKPNVLFHCKELGYTEDQTEKMLSHYEITFKNWDGKWLNIYQKQNKMKQTAVKWLVEQLFSDNVIFGVSEELFNQAKEMEKQQIVEACYFGSQNLPYEVKEKSESYYNETFKNEKQNEKAQF
jgi:hypothetical protein